MVAFVGSLRDATPVPELQARLATFLDTQTTNNPAQSKYDWMHRSHALVRELLSQYPPSPENIEIRKDIFQILDFPIHVNNYASAISKEELEAFNQSVNEYIGAAKSKLFDELENTKSESGIIVWKLYNMGFIIRSPKRTIAIDITGNPQTFVITDGTPPMNRKYVSTLTDADFDRLVLQIDALFVTHLHGDHFSQRLSQKVLAAGKTLVLPTEAMQFDPGSKESKPLFETSQKLIILDKSNEQPVEIAGVSVRNFMGNQGEKTPCNIYHLDIDGVVVIDNGDNYDREQEAKLARCPPANLIIASCWNDMPSFVGNAQKSTDFDQANAILIPAHENELGHSVGHRESYRELYTRVDRLGHKSFPYPPAIPLDCGEKLVIK